MAPLVYPDWGDMPVIDGDGGAAVALPAHETVARGRRGDVNDVPIPAIVTVRGPRVAILANRSRRRGAQGEAIRADQVSWRSLRNLPAASDRDVYLISVCDAWREYQAHSHSH